MKIDLTDITFLILIRLDSIYRLENIVAVTNQMCHYFKTNIVVLEAANYKNNVLKTMLNKKIVYRFIEDKDPILYKTRYFNIMARSVTTPYLSIWDADIVVDKNAVFEAVTYLRTGSFDVAYPYYGRCFEISEIVRSSYLLKKNTQFLYRHKDKLDLLYSRTLTGGAVFVNTQRYFDAGMENEMHYGWGNDDFDRYFRFVNLGYKIYRVDTCLFHLYHPRGKNSGFKSNLSRKISESERLKMKNSSGIEIVCDVKETLS